MFNKAVKTASGFKIVIRKTLPWFSVLINARVKLQKCVILRWVMYRTLSSKSLIAPQFSFSGQSG